MNSSSSLSSFALFLCYVHTRLPFQFLNRFTSKSWSSSIDKNMLLQTRIERKVTADNVHSFCCGTVVHETEMKWNVITSGISLDRKHRRRRRGYTAFRLIYMQIHCLYLFDKYRVCVLRLYLCQCSTHRDRDIMWFHSTNLQTLLLVLSLVCDYLHYCFVCFLPLPINLGWQLIIIIIAIIRDNAIVSNGARSTTFVCVSVCLATIRYGSEWLYIEW